MSKTFNLNIRKVAALPRSLRLRRAGVTAAVGSNAGIAPSVSTSGGGCDCDGHSHTNKALLDSLSTEGNGYLDIEYYTADGDSGDLGRVRERIKAGYADRAHDLDEDSPANSRFIRRDKDDTAAGSYTFGKDIRVEGDAVFDKEVKSQAGFGTADFVPGSSGARIWNDPDTGISYAEADVMHVRRRIDADSIEVRELTNIGGAQMLSPAAARFSRVVPLYAAEGDATPRVYRCFFNAIDGEGREVSNQFKVYDLVRSQTFNLTDTSSSGDIFVAQRYYWRQCSAVGITDDGKEHFIELANWSGAKNGFTPPAAGDSAVTCGNRNDPARQNVIVLAATGIGSPYIYQYKGINDFTLPDNKLVTRIGPDGNRLTGSLIIEDEGVYQGKNVVAALGISSDNIKLEIKNGLGATGVNIEDGTITLTAEKTVFRNADGSTTAMFDGGKLLAKFIDVDTLTARRLFAGSADGRHVEISPDTASVRVTDDSGTERVRLEGAWYNNAADLFGHSSGAVVLPAASGTAAAGAEGTVWTNMRTLGTFSIDDAAQAVVTGGAVTLSAYAPAASGSGMTQQPHGTISFNLLLRVYDDAEHTTLRQSLTLASGSITAAGGTTKRRTWPLYGSMGRVTAGHGVLVLTLGGGIAGTGAYARIAWGTGSDAAQAVALNLNADRYVSRYFANGLALGSRSDNYMLAYRDTNDNVRFEVRNANGGMRLTDRGIETLHHGGSWTTPPLFLFAALVDGDRMTGARSFDGYNPTFTHVGPGRFRLDWPPQWLAKVYLDAGNAFAHVNVTTDDATATARVGTTGVDITTAVAGARADSPFRIIIQYY